MSDSNFKAGFVSLIGKPNAGKSTLMNALVGENLSIITSKAQTTRHRIRGIITGEDFQIVYSDTPGIIEPKYKLQESMMGFVNESLEDADVIFYVIDLFEDFNQDFIVERLKLITTPIVLVLNKIDLAKSQEQVEDILKAWGEKLKFHKMLPVSALEKFNINELVEIIKEMIPVHPAYFGADELTDKSERFITSEIIREKIFLNYKKEIPYSTEVLINSFSEEEKIIRIQADILVERATQRAIIIGHQGKAIKKVGIEARKDLEEFFGKQVFLETYVKVEEDWRRKENKLRSLGYLQN